MKTYNVTYTLEATIPVKAESPAPARWKFQEHTLHDLACFASDSLVVQSVVEEGKEPEGLSRLKVGDMMSRAKW